MGLINKLDEKYGNNGVWQFVKFNLVSMFLAVIQLVLANLLPLVFDSMTAKLPSFLQPIFDAKTLFDGDSKYVVDGVVTWGYVLPFFLSNFIANLIGYFINMKTTFRGKGTRAGLIAYFVILIVLILFTTWLQGLVTARLSTTSWAVLARTIAMYAAGFFQLITLFPLEKYVLFKE